MSKVSIIVTILNEEKTIRELLKALLVQNKKPQDIILVDAGSTDRTTKIIREYQIKHNNIELVVEPDINRSQGRNKGIERSHSEIIAVTDAGCIPKKDWLKKITKPFKDKSIDVVSGFYIPTGDSVFQKSLALYTSIMPHQVKLNKFLPASRSIAFTKNIWKKVGGFPEKLNTCEDRIFVQNLKKNNAKFYFAKDAIVYWEQKNSFSDAFWQIHNYAAGDIKAKYQPHVSKIVLVWIRYLIAFWLALFFPWLLVFFVIQYLGWLIGKGYPYVKDKRASIYIPLLQISSDLAVMSGSIAGLIARRKN
jgi:glycosyltransferase involved in cell wall biosynthesis